MASLSFSTLVQTKSIERVLAPIATQVSNLIILNDASVKDQHAFPDLVSSAEHIFQTVRTLTDTGFTLAHESSDERLSCDMPGACSQVLEAGNNLLTAAHQLCLQPRNLSVRSMLVESAKKVLEYTVNVLLTSDDAEVRKIIYRANVVMENLRILQNVQSWDGFRRHFQHFNDNMLKLLALCEKRKKELVSPAKQGVIASSITVLEHALSELGPTTQKCMKNPDNRHNKASCDYIVSQIFIACSEIVKTVETKDVESNIEEQSHFVTPIMDQKPPELTAGQLSSGDGLDYYLDAIVRNSLVVAEKCDHQKRKLRIAKACKEVLETRNKLKKVQEAIIASPSSERYRQEFDLQTDRLQQCLHYLDGCVTVAIISGVCVVFADFDTPIQNLVAAATSPVVRDGKLLNYNQAMSRLKQQQRTFQDHASKLCQAANHASSIAADPDRVHAIRSGIAQIELLTPLIINVSSELRQNPQNTKSLQSLKTIQQQWRIHISVLSDLSVGAVSSGDFLSTTEVLAKECVTKCREALGVQDLEKLMQQLSLLVGVSEKAVHVCQAELQGAADPLLKSRLTEVTSSVNSILPVVASLSTDVICNIQEPQFHVNFLERAVLLTEKLGEMRSIVKRSPIYLKDNSFEDTDLKSSGPPVNSVMCNLSNFPKVNPDVSNVRYQSSGTMQQPENIQMRRNSPAVLPTANSDSLPLTQAQEQSPREIAKKNRNSRNIENYIKETRLCLLLGLNLVEADDIQMLGKLSLLLRGSPSSLMSRLLEAVSQSDYAVVERRINELTHRASSLKDFANEPALRRSKNKDGSSLAINTSLDVYESTADIVQLAWKVAANPSDKKAATQLTTKCDEWNEKLDIVRGTVDKLLNPWSVVASNVVQAVMLKDQQRFSKQVSNLKQHVLRMRELASSAKSAADAEDAVDVSVEGEPPARNQESLRRIELVMVKSAEMDELTKRFIIMSQEVLKNQTIDLDSLEFLRRDWACKVKSLILAVDDITVGTSAPVDGFCTAAQLGDAQTVRDRGKLLNTYILNLKEMANGCSAGHRDKEKADKAQETVLCVDKLTKEFQDAVLIVQEKGRSEATTVEASLLYMTCVERVVLLQREWSVKVHLFTSLIDDMTADVSAHVDRLAGAALSASRVDRSLKLEYLRGFEVQSNKLSSKVARVRNHACLTISNSNDQEKVQRVLVTCDFLDRLTPQVIAAARGLADNPDQPTVEHFQMLRRQWSSRAHFLMATLHTMKNVQYPSVEVVTRELLASIDNNDPDMTTIRDVPIHYHPEPSQRSRTSLNVNYATRVRSSTPNHSPRNETSTANHSPRNSETSTPNHPPRNETSTPNHPPRNETSTPNHPPRNETSTPNHPPRNETSTPNHPPRNETSTPNHTTFDVRLNDRDTRDRVDELENSFDVIDSLVSSLSDLAVRREQSDKQKRPLSHRPPLHRSTALSSKTDDNSEVRRLKGPKGSDSDMELHRKSHSKDFGSTESLNDDDLRRRTWGPVVLRRAVSIDGLNRAGSRDDSECWGSKKTSVSIARAAAHLRDEADKWEDENNSFVQVAKNMARQMFTMATMTKKRRRPRDTTALIDIAKNVANDCQVMWKFANIIAQHCVDQKSAQEIYHCAESIPTLGTQLSIIASVKSATPEDRSAENVLVRNAQNLMEAVVKTLRVTEGASMKGLNPVSSTDHPGHTEATDLVFEWKRKLRRQRSLEVLAAERGSLGLRLRDRNYCDPSLVDIVHI